MSCMHACRHSGLRLAGVRMLHDLFVTLDEDSRLQTVEKKNRIAGASMHACIHTHIRHALAFVPRFTNLFFCPLAALFFPLVPLLLEYDPLFATESKQARSPLLARKVCMHARTHIHTHECVHACM